MKQKRILLCHNYTENTSCQWKQRSLKLQGLITNPKKQSRLGIVAIMWHRDKEGDIGRQKFQAHTSKAAQSQGIHRQKTHVQFHKSAQNLLTNHHTHGHQQQDTAARKRCPRATTLERSVPMKNCTREYNADINNHMMLRNKKSTNNSSNRGPFVT